MTVEIPDLRAYPKLTGKTLLICVGAAKCATSWLHDYLGSRAEMAVSPLKELHFFDSKFSDLALGDPDGLALARLSFQLKQAGETVENLRRRAIFQASVDRTQMIYDDNAYFGHFDRLSGPRKRCFCDLTPSYSVIGVEGFTYMKRFCASQGMEVKILFLMRDPVQRFWSQLRHLQQLNPVNDVATKWRNALSAPALLARADYCGIIQALEKVFPSSQLLYLFYESLFESDAAIRRLCDFLGIPFAPAVAERRQNETTVMLPLPDDARDAFRRHLSRQYDFCQDRFGSSVPDAWLD
ncbi:sulfotransferase [Ruegeria aquimaris]|uniref:Sulfotransferase n=1 Tax=Ruegeria aquimaris TaxID=2984333 RepID=A0ABT3AK88_9RHOB|nr:sulfotransferase [Ruegeria sp. XHP0148]MCV2889063.1 sulfotransferase [Ruegeria sp. XHP0148]